MVAKKSLTYKDHTLPDLDTSMLKIQQMGHSTSITALMMRGGGLFDHFFHHS